RDLKPGNILMTADGEPKISDFGLAKQLDSDSRHTSTGAIMGTPGYMAPEQAAGRTDEIGPLSDVYALGVILYEMLTGATPFAGPPPIVLFNVIHTQPPSPRSLNRRVPLDLETICLKCLEKEPGQRYASAKALAADLRRYLNGEAIRARTISVWERGWRRLARHRGGALLPAALALLLVLGGVIGLWAWKHSRDAESRRRQYAAAIHLYAANMKRVEEFANQNQREMALKLLEDQRPKPGHVDVRGFEWFYLHRLS